MGLWPIKNTAEYSMSPSKVEKPRGNIANLSRAGMGRKKGTPNKVTKSLKEMILGALDKAGGEVYLQHQAEDNPGPFLALIGKVLPSTMAITGPEGKDLKITFEVIRPQVINTKLENLSQKSPISPGKYLDIEIKT